MVWFVPGLRGTPDQNSSFLARIGNVHIGDGALGEKVCVATALSFSRFLGTVAIGESGEEPEGGAV